MVLKFVKYSIFLVIIGTLLCSFSLSPLSLKLKSLDLTKKPAAAKTETAKPAPTVGSIQTTSPTQDFKLSAQPTMMDSGNSVSQTTPPPQTTPPEPANKGPKMGSLLGKKPTSNKAETPQLQPNPTPEQPKIELQNEINPTAQSADQEKPKDDDFALEKLEQTKRDWQESPNERSSYMKEAEDYYKKIADLVKNSGKIMSEKEKVSEDINSQLNQTYSQASSTMGNFVEIGRNIENYVHGQIEKYAEQKKY